MFRHITKTLLLSTSFVAISIVWAPASWADVTGRNCATAGTIVLNTKHVVTDTAHPAVYRIVLEKRGLLDVSVDASNMDLWTMELLDASCMPVPGVGGDTSLVTGRFSEITVPHLNLQPQKDVWTLDPGVYFIRFSPDPSAVFGAELTFQTRYTEHYGHDFKTAEPVALPGSIETALLYGKDREVFRVNLPEPGIIRAWTTEPADSVARPWLDLYFADFSSAAELLSDVAVENGFVSVMLDAGTYYISAEPGKADRLGPFTLHLDAHVQPD